MEVAVQTSARLVVRPPNWLGDAVLALPAMAAIRRAFPQAHLTVAAVPGVAALFREGTDARPNHVLDLPTSTRQAIAVLEGGGFDLGLLLPNSFRSAWQFWRAGIRERWGYGTGGRGLLLTRASRVTSLPRGQSRHQADYYRALVQSWGFEAPEDERPVVAASSASAARADALLAQYGLEPGRPFVGFAPGAAYGHAKQWPPDRVVALAARLMDSNDVAIVVVGASHDRDTARAVESSLRVERPARARQIVNLTGRTSLGALVGVLSRASAFVSNDSGAMHVAAAVGCPVVAIFGPTDERATHPLGIHEVITEPVFCRPCMLRDCPIDHRCMKRISVDRVHDAVIAHLARAGR